MLNSARYTPLRQALSLAGCVCALGCEQQRPPSHYSVLTGKVIACHTDTGELNVRATRRTPQGPAEETVYCLITRDSEIYVNDKFSSIDEIQIGDLVELVGRHDPNPQAEQFVVSAAYLDHPLPPAPQPALLPASAPVGPDATGEHG